MAYYRRVRELREDHDLTQREVAAQLGMSQPQYFRYEQGYRDLPTDILVALAKLYDTSADYILGLTDDPRPRRGGRESAKKSPPELPEGSLSCCQLTRGGS